MACEARWGLKQQAREASRKGWQALEWPVKPVGD
jgi:hypothetical protein